jgi:pimeloyl-ACP methyl ester carboxylesterase
MTREPLVMIPGLMADARLFLPQMVRLGTERACHVCIAAKGDTVEQMSEAMITGLPEKFALLGHGLGGDIALDIIRRAPDRVTRVALMATDPLSEPPQTAVERETRMVMARAGRLVEAMALELPVSAVADSPWRDEIMALVKDMALGLGEGVFLRQSRALQRRPDQQKTMRKVKLPVLVIAGRVDTLVPLRRQEFTANLMPYGTLNIIEDAGHLAPLEQPEAVSEALEAFLNGPMMLR